MPGDDEVAALVPSAVRDDARGGALDLAGAALLEPDPHHERARLVSRGFVDGCARWWEAPGTTVQFTALRLRGDHDAAVALLDTQETLRAAGLEVQGVPIISAQMIDDDGSVIGVAAAASACLHLLAVVAVAADGPDPASTARTLVRTARDRAAAAAG